MFSACNCKQFRSYWKHDSMHNVTVMYVAASEQSAIRKILLPQYVYCHHGPFGFGTKHLIRTQNFYIRSINSTDGAWWYDSVCHIMKNVHSVTYGKNLLLCDQMYNVCLTKGLVAVFRMIKLSPYSAAKCHYPEILCNTNHSKAVSHVSRPFLSPAVW